MVICAHAGLRLKSFSGWNVLIPEVEVKSNRRQNCIYQSQRTIQLFTAVSITYFLYLENLATKWPKPKSKYHRAVWLSFSRLEADFMCNDRRPAIWTWCHVLPPWRELDANTSDDAHLIYHGVPWYWPAKRMTQSSRISMKVVLNPSLVL